MATLQQLLEDGSGSGLGVEVGGLAYDSRAVQPGDAFFALAGGTVDGASYVAQARERGAVVAVGEAPAPDEGAYVRVESARRALAIASHRFHGAPSEQFRLAGVTGTAGKTTTVFALESVLRAAGLKTGALGTVTYRYGDCVIPAPLTTPQSLDLARILRAMADSGVQAVAMEVTSHALDQHRSTGCRFDAVAFTNLSREHLDYHEDMEDYFRAKRKLFTDYGVGRRAAINVDDAWGRRLVREVGRPVLGFGTGRDADVRATEIWLDSKGTRAIVETPSGAFDLHSNLIGEFNLMNLLAATSLAFLMEIPLESIAKGLAALGQVPGRLENVGINFGRRVYVDYAHKLEPLERVLKLARQFTPGRLITVFGCGGDRDRGKRPLMGKVAAELSDIVVLTSDNPRSEDPLAILGQIERGVSEVGGTRLEPSESPVNGSQYAVVEDRRSAIELAVGWAGPRDTVMICGKGHEDFQQIGTERHHFDDREIARRALERTLNDELV